MSSPALIMGGPNNSENKYFPFGYTCNSYGVNLVGNYTQVNG